MLSVQRQPRVEDQALRTLDDMASKTRPSGEDVTRFLDRLEDPVKRADSERLIAMMSAATGSPAAMWGPSASARTTTRMKAVVKATLARWASHHERLRSPST